MDKYGILASRKYEDVKNVVDEKLNYDSNKNTWKYAQKFSGSITITIPEGESSWQETITLTHNLGYKPQLLGYFNADIDPVYDPVGVAKKIPGRLGFYRVDPVYDTIESAYYPGVNSSTIGFSFLQGASVSPATTEATVNYVAYILVEPEVNPWYE